MIYYLLRNRISQDVSLKKNPRSLSMYEADRRFGRRGWRSEFGWTVISLTELEYKKLRNKQKDGKLTIEAASRFFM